MIEQICAVLEKIIDLLKERQIRKKERFSEMFSQLMDKLVSIHGNYITLFEEVISQLKSNSPIPEVTEFLRRERLQYEPHRVLVCATLGKLHQCLDGPEKEFIEQIRIYLLAHLSGTTPSLKLFRYLEWNPEEIKRASLVTAAESSLSDLRRYWNRICQHYEKLRLALFS